MKMTSGFDGGVDLTTSGVTSDSCTCIEKICTIDSDTFDDLSTRINCCNSWKNQILRLGMEIEAGFTDTRDVSFRRDKQVKNTPP